MKHNPKILIVEDNKSNHQLYRDVFEQNGFEVTIRENADGAFVDEVDALRPDIISMDLMMGKDGTATERDGFQAIEVLKFDSRTKKIPVIVLTNFSEETKIQQAKELGAVDFISVPGQTIQKIPEHFMRYLENPKRYKSSHPIFREE